MGGAPAPGIHDHQALTSARRQTRRYRSCAKTGQKLWHFACSFPSETLDIKTWRAKTWHALLGTHYLGRIWPWVIPPPMIEGARAVLTSRPAEANSAFWRAAQIGTAMVLSVVTWTSAGAGNIAAESCVGTARSFNCVDNWGTSGDPFVRVVPEPLSETERAQMAARDHRWLAHCRPVVQRDDYGVARYYYAEPGCEFGIGSD